MNERPKVIDKTPNIRRENSTSPTRKTDSNQPMNSPVKKILYLHRTIGNRAVERLFKSGAIRAKFKIGQPGDIYEQEADRVVEQVMRMPEPHSSNGKGERANVKGEKVKSSCDQNQIMRVSESSCPECPERKEEEEQIRTKPIAFQITPLVQRQEKEEEEEILMTKGTPGRTLQLSDDLYTRLSQSRGGGQPLSDADRNFMEERLGVDFSGVRVHIDSEATQISRELNAEAFTHGRDIYFGAGRYSPSTSSGKRLLAHELTHMVHQGQSGHNIRIQRSCGQAAITAAVGTRSGCSDRFDRTFVSGSLPFRFNKSCDEFAPGHSTALIRFASGLPATATLEIHGFASVDGPPNFNQNLGCARALAARKLLTDPPPLGASIAVSRITGIINHGPVPGSAADRRSVVIRTTTPTPPPTLPSPPPTVHPPIPAGCSPNPRGTHLPPVGTAHRPPAHMLPCFLTEAYVRTSPEWCLDAQQLHSGETCYREIPSSYCASGDQYCYTRSGCCHNSRDVVSPVDPSSPGAGRTCTNAYRCFPGHIWHDVTPEFFEEMGRREIECIERCQQLPWYIRGFCMQSCSPQPL